MQPVAREIEKQSRRAENSVEAVRESQNHFVGIDDQQRPVCDSGTVERVCVKAAVRSCARQRVRRHVNVRVLIAAIVAETRQKRLIGQEKIHYRGQQFWFFRLCAQFVNVHARQRQEALQSSGEFARKPRL